MIGTPCSSSSTGVPDIAPGEAVDVCGDLDDEADAKLPNAVLVWKLVGRSW